MRAMKEPNLLALEINITNICNLYCNDCDRLLSLAPGTGEQNMTLEQITKFIQQSVSLHYPWKMIKIMGGEPTIHPQFEEIVRLMADYKNTDNPELILEVATNGYGAENPTKLAWLNYHYPEIIITNTKKKSIIQKRFDKICMAPMDLLPENANYRYMGCWITEKDGLGLAYSGFYCCSTGAAIDRIFGYNFGIKDLQDLTRRRLKAMYRDLCSKCGHYCLTLERNNFLNCINSPTFHEALAKYEEREAEPDVDTPGNICSLTWEKALHVYKSRNNDLDKY